MTSERTNSHKKYPKLGSTTPLIKFHLASLKFNGISAGIAEKKIFAAEIAEKKTNNVFIKK
jgi:hypothetical protein